MIGEASSPKARHTVSGERRDHTHTPVIVIGGQITIIEIRDLEGWDTCHYLPHTHILLFSSSSDEIIIFQIRAI